MIDKVQNFLGWIQATSRASNLHSPATPEAISSLEKALVKLDRLDTGFVFPASYRTFLEHYDGGYVQIPSGEEVFFLSVSGSERAGRSLILENGDDAAFMDEEIDTYADFQPLVIFADDGGGNFWGFDTSESNSGVELPVVFGDHETGRVTSQADNFAEFLNQIMEGRLERDDLAHYSDDYRELPRHPKVVDEVLSWEDGFPPRMYRIAPDQVGCFGKRTVAIPPKDNNSPATIVSVEAELDRWDEDALVTNGAYLVTASLADDMIAAGLSGFRFEEVIISTSSAFRRKAKHNPELLNLPKFRWLVVTGVAEYVRSGELLSHGGDDLSIGKNLEPTSVNQIIPPDLLSTVLLPYATLIGSARFVHLLKAHGAPHCELTECGWVGI